METANKPNDTDHSTLLLQVLAHDLLAPLTAIRWQAELLARPGTARAKKERYLAGITESTVLGITITKHVHVAARVLAGSYEPLVETLDLGGVVRKALTDIATQYGRHGVTLDHALNDERVPYAADPELVDTLMWAVAKFFLTIASNGTSVRVEGGVVSHAGVAAAYVVTMRTPISADERGRYERYFAPEQRTVASLDQSALFGMLVREVASVLGVALSARESDALCTVEVAFSLR